MEVSEHSRALTRNEATFVNSGVGIRLYCKVHENIDSSTTYYYLRYKYWLTHITTTHTYLTQLNIPTINNTHILCYRYSIV